MVESLLFIGAGAAGAGEKNTRSRPKTNWLHNTEIQADPRKYYFHKLSEKYCDLWRKYTYKTVIHDNGMLRNRKTTKRGRQLDFWVPTQNVPSLKVP